MHSLNNDIYWLTDKLRRMELFGLENTERFKMLKAKLIALAKLRTEAEKKIKNLTKDIRDG